MEHENGDFLFLSFRAMFFFATVLDMRLFFLIPLSALLLTLPLLGSGCAGASKNQRHRDYVRTQAEYRMQLSRMLLPANPTYFSNDYAYPVRSMRQTFQWNPYGTEWRIMVVDHQGEYAGFDMKKTYDLTGKLDGMVLYFELWPAEAATSLAIALLDGRSSTLRYMASLPIKPYQIQRVDERGWALIAIPLTRFGSVMKRVEDARTAPAHPYSLDWSQISGVRLLWRSSNPRLSRLIILRNLQFAPAIWVRD